MRLINLIIGLIVELFLFSSSLLLGLVYNEVAVLLRGCDGPINYA